MTHILKFSCIAAFYLALTTAPAISANPAYPDNSATADTARKPGTHDVKPRSPRKAALLAIVPGLGQGYNGDFWKLPIVYAALGGSIFTVHLNALKYHDYLKAYWSFYDQSTGTPAHGITEDTEMPVRVRKPLNTKSMVKLLTKDQIVRNKDVWRRYRNVSILTSGLIYVLTIIEANVAAHLKTFDVSDDLSVRIGPGAIEVPFSAFAPGLQVVFNFK
ncbi:hypothetical protein J2Y45_004003 [Dyadobacter sp. BE34]|uniref:DUF5683 domain-containing protein n=1 Tax=Dyadobacter fermentans TaxID=94254 RepID=A0ABU1R074_9BACT|nr:MULTISPECIES: DUF5683 domain-containing protein [Dyadobacter]MDR6806811.1 hypothetical protein [Dyadobacter fermentans]MDR7044553.1 hypothetical protein [Dyadobacter sp. BE242]MDR7198863.1 hypothetical protein [Dyadobacter sp. BE34]MDR7216825.1 hypothetical protein [Dyadobacter sp. BE31]MDR7263649.1 hypothetical protein [Dyadobacter sp. BE32]